MITRGLVPCIVDDNVDSTKALDGRINDTIAILHRVIVSDRLTTCLDNLLHNLIGCTGGCAFTRG